KLERAACAAVVIAGGESNRRLTDPTANRSNDQAAVGPRAAESKTTAVHNCRIGRTGCKDSVGHGVVHVRQRDRDWTSRKVAKGRLICQQADGRRIIYYHRMSAGSDEIAVVGSERDSCRSGIKTARVNLDLGVGTVGCEPFHSRISIGIVAIGYHKRR